MVEDPLFTLQECIIWSGSKVWDAINSPNDLIRLPFDGKDVICIGNRLTKIIDFTVALPTGVSRSMQSAKGVIGSTTDKFHDIDLTSLCPTDLVNIGAEHPEGGP